MDGLNPVAPLSSLQYLAFYGVLVVVAIVVARLAIAAATGPKPSPFTIDADRDPYDVAYLRGSGNELLRFSLFDLVRQGYLTMTEPIPKLRITTIGPSPLAPPADRLSPFLQSVVAFYSEPRTTSELFASPLPAAAQAYGSATYETRLRAAGFYAAPAAGHVAVLARLAGGLILIGVPVLRLWHAFQLGHNNIGFLLIEAIFGITIFFPMTKVPRLAPAGRAYLDRLRTAMRPQAGFSAATAATATGATALFVAATGFSALAGTPYAGMSKVFRNSAGTGACSTCGSSSGGDSGGGGGCGGGGCGG